MTTSDVVDDATVADTAHAHAPDDDHDDGDANY